MRKKLNKLAGLLGCKLTASSIDETFGITLPGCASKKTQGNDGYFAENFAAKPTKAPDGPRR